MDVNSMIDSLRQNLTDNIKRQLRRQQFNFCTKFRARFDRNVPPLVNVLYRDLERTFDASLGLIISRSLDEIHLSKTDGGSDKPKAANNATESEHSAEIVNTTDETEVIHIPDDPNEEEGELEIQPANTSATLKRSLEPEPDYQFIEPSPVARKRSDRRIIKECIICPIELCFEICDSKRDLDEHLIHVHNLRPHYCALKNCGLYFLEGTNLMNHQLKEHEKVTEWQCQECDTLLPSRMSLNRHHTLAHFHRIFRCAVGACKHNSSDYEKVLAHVRSNHKPEYELLRKAKLAVEANFNSKRVRVSSPVIYECSVDDCGQQFQAEANLIEHLETHSQSAANNQYACSWPGCHRQSQSKEAILRHISEVHLPQPVRTRASRQLSIPKIDIDPGEWLRTLGPNDETI